MPLRCSGMGAAMTEPLHPSYQRISDVRDALDAVEQTKHAIAAADWAMGEKAIMDVLQDLHPGPKVAHSALAMVGIRAISTFDKEVLSAAQDQAWAAVERDVPTDGDSSAIVVVLRQAVDAAVVVHPSEDPYLRGLQVALRLAEETVNG